MCCCVFKQILERNINALHDLLSLDIVKPWAHRIVSKKILKIKKRSIRMRILLCYNILGHE